MHAHATPRRRARRLLSATLLASALAALPAGPVGAEDRGPDMRILPTPSDVLLRVDLGRREARFTSSPLRGARGWVTELAPRKGRNARPWPTPATDGERVFVGGPLDSTEMFAFDLDSGRLVWRAQLTDNGPTPAVLRDRRVYVNTQSCTVYAFDADTGRKEWSRYLAGSLESVPSATPAEIVSARPHRHGARRDANVPALTLLDAETGRIVADVALDGDGRGAPVLRNDHAYLTTKSGSVYCVDLAAGRTRWRKPLGARGMPAVDHTGVYVAGQSAVARLDHRTGLDRYTEVAITPSSRDPRPEPAPVAPPPVRGQEAAAARGGGFWGDGLRPVLHGERLIVASGRTIRIFDKRSGAETAWWELDVEGDIVGPPALGGDTVVVATRRGEIRGVDLTHGEVAWGVDLGTALSGSVILDDGYALAATDDGRLVRVLTGDLRADGWPMWGGSPNR